MEYKYKCNKCRGYFGVVKMLEQLDREEECPRCESKDTFRAVQTQMVQKKGTNWASSKTLL